MEVVGGVEGGAATAALTVGTVVAGDVIAAAGMWLKKSFVCHCWPLWHAVGVVVSRLLCCTVQLSNSPAVPPAGHKMHGGRYFLSQHLQYLHTRVCHDGVASEDCLWLGGLLFFDTQLSST